MLPRTLAFIALGLAVLQVPVFAKGPAAEPFPLPANEYFLEKLPPPPDKDSALDKADIALSALIQAQATPEQIQHATMVATDLKVFTFSEVIGSSFTKANYPETAAFFKRLDATANIPKNFIKDHYARVRPYLAHPDQIKMLVPADAGFSYPSGHVTRAELAALVLAQLDPAQKGAILDFVDRVAKDRIVGGMHYRSDTTGSMLLGAMVYDELMKEPDFVAALNALKAEEWAQQPQAAPAASASPTAAAAMPAASSTP